MNKILYVFLIFLLFCVYGYADGEKDNLIIFYNNFDYHGLIEAYNSLKMNPQIDAEYYFTLARITFYLSRIADAVENSRGVKGKDFAQTCISYAEQALIHKSFSESVFADLYFYLAAMYERLIYNAKTGMRYNNKKLDYLKEALEKNPRHIEANLLNARTLLYTPVAFGGDPQKAIRIIRELFNQYPQNQEVLLSLVDYYLYIDQKEKAKEYIDIILHINPYNLTAKNILEELQLEEKGYVVKEINISGEIKTKKSIVMNKAKGFVGQKYSTSLKKQIIKAVNQIKSVDNCAIKIISTEDEKIIINLFLSENNITLINLDLGLSLSFDYNKEINFLSGPAPSYPLFSAVYLEKNIFGSSGDFIFEISGPHIHTEFINFGAIDIKHYFEALFVPQTICFYNNGKLIDDLLIKSPLYILDIALGKEFDFNLSIFWHNKLVIQDWAKHEDNSSIDFELPSDNLTYNTRLNLLFENINYIDNLWIIDGYKIEIYPELIYKVNYQSWGNVNELIHHNEDPGLRFSLLFGYYKQLWQEHNLRLEARFFTGFNLYKRELWRMGKDIMNNPFDQGLSGYYLNEFDFNTGYLLNLYYSFPLIIADLRTYLRYDLFHNIDNNSLYHGLGFGFLVRLPFEIELAAQLGIGLNAQREEWPALELDLVLKRVFNL